VSYLNYTFENTKDPVAYVLQEYIAYVPDNRKAEYKTNVGINCV
jgi:hypothetical protein